MRHPLPYVTEKEAKTIVKKNPNQIQINLNGNHKKNINLIRKIFKRPNIQKFIIKNSNRITYILHFYFKKLFYQGNLKEFKLDNLLNIDTKLLSIALNHQKLLKSLRLQYIQINSLGHTLNALKQQKYFTSIELNCVFENQNHLTETQAQAITRIFQANKSLNFFKISNYRLQGHGAAKIAKALDYHTNLRYLNISNCKLKDNDAELLACGLKNNEGLLSLNLAHNNIGSAGATAIATALTKNTHLQVLNLKANAITSDGAKSIADLLSVHKKLQVLDLAYNKIDINGIKALTQALKSNNNLLSFNIAPANEESLELIANIFSYNHTIIKLSLSPYYLYLKEALLIVKILMLGKNLQYLDLAAMHTSPEAAYIIAQTLIANKTLRFLNLNGYSGYKVFLKALQDNFTLTTLILHPGVNVIGEIKINKFLTRNYHLQQTFEAYIQLFFESTLTLFRAEQRNKFLQVLLAFGNVKNLRTIFDNLAHHLEKKSLTTNLKDKIKWDMMVISATIQFLLFKKKVISSLASFSKIKYKKAIISAKFNLGLNKYYFNLDDIKLDFYNFLNLLYTSSDFNFIKVTAINRIIKNLLNCGDYETLKQITTKECFEISAAEPEHKDSSTDTASLPIRFFNKSSNQEKIYSIEQNQLDLCKPK